MKAGKAKTIFVLVLLFVSTGLYAQDCSPGLFCNDNDLGENFDYRSQSSYALLAPGDTARTSVVVYGRKENRVLICFDPKLGNVSYKIIAENRVTERFFNEEEVVKEEIEEPIYAKDANGELVQEIDEWGEPMADWDTGEPVYKIERYETIVNYDTTWHSRRIKREQIVFNSVKNTDKKFWQIQQKKTRRYIIEVVVPAGDNSVEGCVSVLVGRKSVRKGKFKKSKGFN